MFEDLGVKQMSKVTWNVTAARSRAPARSGIAVAGFTANGRGVLVDGREGVFVGNEKKPFRHAKDAEVEDVNVTCQRRHDSGAHEAPLFVSKHSPR